MLSAILTIIGLIIGFSEKVHLFKRPFNLGKITVITLLVSAAVISFFKERSNDFQQQHASNTIDSLNTQAEALTEQITFLRKESKASQREYADSLVNYHNYTTMLLAKYGYKVDTLRSSITRIGADQQAMTRIIKDSLPSSSNPVFALDMETGIFVQQDSGRRIKLLLPFVSDDAGSKDFNVAIKAAGSVSLAGPYNYLGRFGYFGPATTFNSGGSVSLQFEFERASKYEPELFYFSANGTYKNLDKTRTYRIDRIYCYNIATRSTTIITGGTERRLAGFFQSQKN